MKTRRRCCGPCHLAPTARELTRLDGFLAVRCALLCACSARIGREQQQMRHRGRHFWRRRRRLRLCWSSCGRPGRPWCGPDHLGPSACLPNACKGCLIGRRRCSTRGQTICALGPPPSSLCSGFPYPYGLGRFVLETCKAPTRTGWGQAGSAGVVGRRGRAPTRQIFLSTQRLKGK